MTRVRNALPLIWIGMLVAACTAAPTALPVQPTRAPAASVATATAEPVHLKVGVLNFMSHAPLFIARDAGYFAAQGLDVELVTFGATESEMMTGVMQGQLDVGATTIRAATINGVLQGSGIKVVADKGYLNPEAECPTEALVAPRRLLEDGTLDTPAGLKGLTITVGAGTLSQLVTERILAEAGLTLDDVVDVQLDFTTRVEALKSGALDVATLAEPWVTRARVSGAGEIWRTYADVFPRFSLGVVMFGPSMLEREHDVGVRFLAAYLQAVEQFGQGKTPENVEIIAGFTQLDPNEIREACWTSFQPDGMIDTESLAAFEDWALDRGLLDGIVPVEDLYDPTFAKDAVALLGR